jgi:predicted nucleic acid-binding protein
MSVLVDTNLLLRSIQPGNSHFQIAVDAIAGLRQTERMCVTAQNLYEFWAVCTRPLGLNGMGMDVSSADAELAKIRALFSFLPDDPAVYAEWHRLIVQHDVKGKNAHDARLVASMLVHGVTHLLTFNLSDFTRFAEIQVIDPVTAVQPPTT